MQTAFLLHYTTDIQPPLTLEQKQTLAKYDMGVLGHHHEVLTDRVTFTGLPNFTPYAQLATDLRALNPRIQIGMGQAVAHVRPWDMSALWTTDYDLLHYPNGQPLIGYTSGIRHGIYNYGAQVVRDRVTDGFVNFLLANNLSHIQLDGFSPGFYADVIRQAPYVGEALPHFNLTNGCLDGPAHTDAWWQEVLGKFGEQLRWRCEERGLSTQVVGISPVPYSPTTSNAIWLGPQLSNTANYASGSTLEHPEGAYGDLPTFINLLAGIKRVTDKRRGVWFCYTRRFYVGPYGELPPLDGQPSTNKRYLPDTAEVRRFFQATYHLVQEPGVYYSYWPFDPYRGWNDQIQNAVYWSADWEHDLGMPLGPYQTQADPYGRGLIYYRLFSKATVLVNPNAVPVQFSHPTALGNTFIWSRTGTPLNMAADAPYYRINMPALTGWLLLPA